MLVQTFLNLWRVHRLTWSSLSSSINLKHVETNNAKQIVFGGALDTRKAECVGGTYIDIDVYFP